MKKILFIKSIHLHDHRQLYTKLQSLSCCPVNVWTSARKESRLWSYDIHQNDVQTAQPTAQCTTPHTSRNLPFLQSRMYENLTCRWLCTTATKHLKWPKDMGPQLYKPTALSHLKWHPAVIILLRKIYEVQRDSDRASCLRRDGKRSYR